MNELHLFAGVGGGILGGMFLGHSPVCAVEIEPSARKILHQRQRDEMLPWFPVWDDVRTFDGRDWRGTVDVICGGFPCQDISAAGSGVGIKGARSSLWCEFARIASEIRPRVLFIENSPHLRTKGLATVIKDLARLGYAARWGVIGSGDFEALHARKRMWILAANPAQVREWRDQCHEEMGKSWRESLPTEPEPPRMVDAVADRVDRLNAIGNGQDPITAANVWRILQATF